MTKQDVKIICYTVSLGDLGRHDEGPPYDLFSKKFSKISKKKCQVWDNLDEYMQSNV